MAHVGRWEDSLQELLLSLHHVGPSDPTEVVRLDGGTAITISYPYFETTNLK